MEGIGEIILFVILITISIVQQVVKNNAKKKRQQSTSQSAPAESSYWGEDDYSDATFGAEPKEEFSYDNVYKPLAYEELSIAASHEMEGQAATMSLKELRSSEIGQVNDTAPANTLISELMDEFDLAKAVIYSEILKPKYEE